jgi:predicted GIY-YIG superfamily endonuclease
MTTTVRKGKSYIYVLKCQDYRYYIGKTSSGKREMHHFRGNGCAWTRKYPPVEILEKTEMTNEDDEDRKTKKYMREFGIENVRGGSYSQIELQPQQEDLLRREFSTISNTCFRCERSGHFIETCPERTRADGTLIESDDDDDDDEEEEEEEEEDDDDGDKDDDAHIGGKRKGTASNVLPEERSKRIHSRSEVTHQHQSSASVMCMSSFRTSHTAEYCVANPTADGRLLPSVKTPQVHKPQPSTNNACYRCGRTGHYSPDCSARHHVNGHYLSSDDYSSGYDSEW